MSIAVKLHIILNLSRRIENPKSSRVNNSNFSNLIREADDLSIIRMVRTAPVSGVVHIVDKEVDHIVVISPGDLDSDTGDSGEAGTEVGFGWYLGAVGGYVHELGFAAGVI
jgi:hypothetical protein